MLTEKKQRKSAGSGAGTGIHIGLIVAVLAGIGLMSVLLPKPTVSEREKRQLRTMPAFSLRSLFSGAYTLALSQFYADTFPGREQLIDVAAALGELKGLRFDDVRIHEVSADDAQAEDTPEAQPVSGAEPVHAGESSGQAAPESDDGENGVRHGVIFVYKGQALQIFGGENGMGRWYAEAVSRYQNLLGDETRIYCLVAPSPIEFALPQRYKSLTAPERPRLDNIRDNLDPRVVWVDAYDAIAQNFDGQYLYFRTDHHWTALGAYQAYRVFAESIGDAPVELDRFEKRTLPGFLGTLYAKTQDAQLASRQDYVDYYVPPTGNRVYFYKKNAPYTPVEASLFGEYAQGTNSYSVFLHGDLPLVRIDTELQNGRSIAVVKESYGNAFVPFLVNHYQHIYVVDERYFQLNLPDFIRQHEVGEVLFINNIFAAHTSYQIQCLETLVTQRYSPSAASKPSSQAETSSEAPAESSSQPPAIVVPDVGNGEGEDQ